MSHLVLVRHGQSEWNEKNLFTGWRDPDLTAQGIDEAKAAGQALKQQGLVFDLAFHIRFAAGAKNPDAFIGRAGPKRFADDAKPSA